MGTEIQNKMYFPGSYSMRDFSDSASSSIWALYHGQKALKNDQYHDSSSRVQAIDGFFGFEKEQLRQTILKHELTFKHQLEELHRLYKRQRELMHEIKRRELHQVSNLPLADPSFRKPFTSGSNNTQSSVSLIKEKNISAPFLSRGVRSKECENSESKCNMFQQSLVNLELPSAVCMNNGGNKLSDLNFSLGSGRDFKSNLYARRANKVVDLNEPVQVEEASFLACVDNLCNSTNLVGEIWRQASSVNAESGFPILSKGSSQSSLAGTNGRSCLNIVHTENEGKHTVGSSYKNEAGRSKFIHDSLSPAPFTSSQVEFSKVEECSPFSPSGNSNKEMRRKRTIFGVEISEGNDDKIEAGVLPGTCKKIFGFSILVPPGSPSKSSCVASDADNGNDRKYFDHNPRPNGLDLVAKEGLHNYKSGLKLQIDLNLSVNDEDAPPTPSLPEAIVKIATTEIDLEASAVLECESSESTIHISFKSQLEESKEHNEELDKAAAEAIIAMSLSEPIKDMTNFNPLSDISCDSLHWFSEIVSLLEGDGDYDEESNSIPDGVDYFELMTLNLKETNIEDYLNKSPSFENENDEETTADVLCKRPRRGQAKRGRQRKDFQRDVLPGLVSLSRQEVTEDFQSFEELFKSSGFIWEPSVSKRNAGKNGRGRRQSGGSDFSCTTTPACVPFSEQLMFNEVVVVEERAVTGWGKRMRRFPRHRCRIGDSTRDLKR